MSSTTHPIRVATRTDCATTTIYHVFFMIEYICQQETERSSFSDTVIDIKVIRKIPNKRAQVDNIEEALMRFAQEAAYTCHSLSSSKVLLENEKQAFGNFVITTGDGNHYFACWRGDCNNRLFFAISRLCIPTFTRQIFEIIEHVPQENLLELLHILSQFPILPAVGLCYKIKINDEVIELNFNSIEQAIDEDNDTIAIRLLNPKMMVLAWEAIVLERKVLVTSSMPTLVAPCVDFLRRLVLPLSIVNTYVPFLPKDMLAYIESPVPYLYGANMDSILESGVDLSDTVVINLDNQEVTFGLDKDYFELNANDTPKFIITKLLKSVTAALFTPLSQWSSRSCIANKLNYNSNGLGSNKIIGSICPPKSMVKTAESILECFIQTNLSLICARTLNVPRAFYRRRETAEEATIKSKSTDRKKTKTFERKYNLACGQINLVRENIFEDSAWLPCWVEMDTISLAIYQFADELPLHYLLNKDIETVSPLPIEPEHHVFEIVTRQAQTKYRFVASDKESRNEWINFIEERLKPVIELNSINIEFSKSSKKESDLRNSSIVCETNEDDNVESKEAEEQLMLSKFRSGIMQTQMVAFMPSQIELDEYDLYVNRKKPLNFNNLAEKLCNSLEDIDIFWNCGRAENITMNLESLSINDFIDNTDNLQIKTNKQNLTLNDVVALQTTANIPKTISDKAISPTGLLSPTSAINSERKSSFSMLGRFFLRKDNKQELVQSPSQSAIGSDIERNMELQKADVNEMILRLKIITSAHRRSDLALNKIVWEERMNAISNLEEEYNNSNILTIKEMNDNKTNNSIYVDLSIINSNYKITTSESIKTENNDVSWYELLWNNLSIPNETDEVTSLMDVRETLLKKYFSMAVDSPQHLVPVFNTLIGHLMHYLDQYDLAIKYYSTGSSLTCQSEIMECIIKKFIFLIKEIEGPDADLNDSKHIDFDFKSFLNWAVKINPISGLHAYRLCTELLHRSIYEKSKDFPGMSLNDPQCILSSHHHVLPVQFNLISKNGDIDGRTTIVSDSSNNTYFSYVPNDSVSDVLNESVICNETNIHPCELSIQLLTLLRELLIITHDNKMEKERSENSSKPRRDSSTNNSSKRLKIVDHMFDELVSSSAFQRFELQACQLQKVNICTLDQDQLLLFFCNVYNIICVHGVIRMTAGSNLYERQTFIKSAKYNISGMFFSLLDIEHGILRKSSTSPMIWGPISFSHAFKDTDPRMAFGIVKPVPFISFVLFTACESSPSLVILRDCNTIREDLSRCFSDFIAQYVRMNMDKKIVFLPEIMRIYWKDLTTPECIQSYWREKGSEKFYTEDVTKGGQRKNMFALLHEYGHKEFSNDLKRMRNEGKRLEKSVIFEWLGFVWVPMIVL